jgi:hypothetical protein
MNIKKILFIVFITIFVFSKFSALSNSVNIKSTVSDFDDDESYVTSLSHPSYRIYKNIVKHSIEMDDFDYLSEPSKKLLHTYDYVIITSDDLVESITSSDFVDWKESIGFNVKIVSITNNKITNQSGIDLAERIRNFLRQYNAEWGIEYVLLIGNYETIPMRYCYPNPDNHMFDPFDIYSGEVPTDYYYADLSSPDSESWDLDGDGFYGEFGEDNPDFFAEVSVGRIPVNDANKVKYTLEKTIAFEQDTASWKKNALNAGAFFYFTNQNNNGDPAMDGAVLSYYIEEDLMDGWTISHYCEQEGLETSVYDWPALNEESFISDWRDNRYSIVNWQGHGWIDRVAHCVWSSDDGDNVPENSEITWPDFININSDLDDDYPSIVTAVSCYVGCPEIGRGGNLGIDLLTNPIIGAAVGVVASARTPYGSFDWSPLNPGGSDSIIYEFNKNMIVNNDRVGDALYNSKYYCNHNFGWDVFNEYVDLYTFNLYGDPSLVLEGVNVKGKPEKPVISGPASGNPRQEYTFSAVANDPNNDDLYYYFDWGDGTDSDWIGLFKSGDECNATHSWNKKGNYEIKVRVKDSNGLVSEWSDPLEVTMPKSKQFITPFIQQFMERLIYRFPLLNKILNQIT